MFFLPTLGENFGHVIIEALGAGTPALISDRTPWRDFDRAGCGWIMPLGNAQLFADRIDSLFEEEPRVSEGRRAAAIDYARRFEDDSGVVDANRKLFLRAMRRSLS
ncbi:glycosyltransferase [Sphingobium sp. Cam5-1]|uniref:glycosyltransferase n=1 Tax=Sphingobium sp. Cam5-1 TaxID=2789327 RepID=UPI0018AD1635|nr:glycosyltransferase [Sphingobium sp. Cam5-1]